MRLVLFFFAAFLCLTGGAFSQPTAAVIYNWETVSDRESIASMGRSLRGSVLERPGKQEVVKAFSSHDIIYINTHTYSGKDHPDAHGALVTGPGFKRDPTGNLIRPQELKQSLAGKPPQLTVLAGCSASNYGWSQSIGGTVISFKTSIKGAGCDLVFKYFFQYWTDLQQNLTVQAALDRAVSSARKDPLVTRLSGGAVNNLYGLQGFERSVTISGDPNLRYQNLRTAPAPPPPALMSLAFTGLIVSPKGERRYQATVQFMANGHPSGHPLTVAYQGEMSGPAGLRVPLSGRLTVPGGGYQADTFDFDLPASALDGHYTLTLTLNSGPVSSLPRQQTWDRTTAKLQIAIQGNSTVEEGKPCSLAATVTGGTPPYRWQWAGPSGGDQGRGSRFTLQCTATLPYVNFGVQIWDSGSFSSKPLTRSVPVQVTPAPVSDLSPQISGPGETAEGRLETFALTCTGGSPPFRAEWKCDGKTYPGNSAQILFQQPGPSPIQILIWDQGKYQKSPMIVGYPVFVYEKLSGSIVGPDEAEPNQRVELSSHLVGGRPELRWAWTAPSGHQLNTPTLKGKVVGQPGDVKVVMLDVEDALLPPQKLHLEKAIQIKAPHYSIEIVGIQVIPPVFKPGEQVQVRASYLCRGFEGPNAMADTTLWLESASGSGRGWSGHANYSVPQGTPHTVSKSFRTDPKGKGGVVRARIKIQVGEVVATRECTAEMKRPGGLQDITVDSRTVRLKVWDHGAEDGDIVSVFLNGKKLSTGRITKAGAILTLHLNPGANTLTVLAHNEGTSSPNTAAVRVTNVVRGPAQQSYSLKTNTKGFFQIYAP